MNEAAYTKEAQTRCAADLESTENGVVGTNADCRWLTVVRQWTKRPAARVAANSDTVARAAPLPASVMQRGRKNTQRERLLSGIIEAANRGGYASASVSAVIGNAGVSRPTFYDYFAGRDDAFNAAIQDVQCELLGEVAAALEIVSGEDATAALARTLVSYAAENPARARFLMGESMAGGTEALQTRDRGINEIAGVLRAHEQATAERLALADLPPEVVVGSVYRLLATRLRRGEATIARLGEELVAWIGAYRRPGAQRRWQTLTVGPEPAASPHVSAVPIQQMPSVFPPGRPRIPEAEITENHRLRILYATARLAEEKGYTATTVVDITRLARVDGRVFYRLFADKQEAFSAVHELGFQQVMDVTSKAFFAAEGWPQRSWEGGRALTQLLEKNPLVAHVGFVEAYAVGPRAVQRIEDSHTAFVFFLQEGLIYASQEVPPSRVAMEAIIASVFEVVYLQARAGKDLQLAGMLPHIAHLWLTPFLGVEEADAFIDSQLPKAAEKRKASARRSKQPAR